MKITKETMDYLTGTKFDNAYDFEIDNNSPKDRLTTIIEQVKGRVVLHVGCCDHIQLIKSKIEDGIWLQKLIEINARQCVGIDINKEALNFVRENNFSQNVYYGDIISEEGISDSIPSLSYDCVVLGEILEHVDNPVDFLIRLRKNLQQVGFDEKNGIIIITVPNLLRFQIKELQRPIERVNTDHRYWFSPFTLSKVLVQAEIYPEELLFTDLYYYDRSPNFFKRIVDRVFSKKSDIKFDNSYKGYNLVAICKLQNMYS